MECGPIGAVVTLISKVFHSKDAVASYFGEAVVTLISKVFHSRNVREVTGAAAGVTLISKVFHSLYFGFEFS